MSIPNWWIRQHVLPYGARPPKRPEIKWEEPRPAKAIVVYKGFGAGAVSAYEGNLETHEYQFFIGRPWLGSNWATCRACKQDLFTVEARKAHFKNHRDPSGTSCAVKIVAAMVLLQKDQACVMCDQRTTKVRWGFPICSDRCLDDWKFSTVVNQAFNHAMLEAARRGWVKK